ISRDQPLVFTDTIDYVLGAVFAAALWTATAALVTLVLANTGLPARIVLTTAALGHALFATASTATLLNGRESLDPVSSVGLVLLLAGYLGFLIVDRLKGVEPRYSGLAMFVASLGMFALGYAWALVAYAGAARAHERQPTRALAGPRGGVPAGRTTKVAGRLGAAPLRRPRSGAQHWPGRPPAAMRR